MNINLINDVMTALEPRPAAAESPAVANCDYNCADYARPPHRRPSLANAWQNRDADAASVPMYGPI